MILDSYRFNVVLWSLEVEAQFYLVAPLLAMIYRVAGQRNRAVIFLGLGVALHFLSPLVFGNANNFFNYALYFMCGMLVADYYAIRDTGSGYQPKTTALEISVLALIPISVVVSNSDWAPELVLPLCCGAVLLAALQGQMIGRVMRNRVLATIGGMCYTIYLYHYLVISLVGGLTSDWFGQLPYELFFLLQLSIHAVVSRHGVRHRLSCHREAVYADISQAQCASVRNNRFGGRSRGQGEHRSWWGFSAKT